MIVTSMQLTSSSRRDIAVLQKESSALEGQEGVKGARSSTGVAIMASRRGMNCLSRGNRMKIGLITKVRR